MITLGEEGISSLARKDPKTIPTAAREVYDVRAPATPRSRRSCWRCGPGGSATAAHFANAGVVVASSAPSRPAELKAYVAHEAIFRPTCRKPLPDRDGTLILTEFACRPAGVELIPGTVAAAPRARPGYKLSSSPTSPASAAGCTRSTTRPRQRAHGGIARPAPPIFDTCVAPRRPASPSSIASHRASSAGPPSTNSTRRSVDGRRFHR